MKTDHEVRRMLNERRKGKTQEQAAARAQMSVRTVRKYERLAQLPSKEHKRTGNQPSHQRKRDALTGKFDDRWRQKYLTFNRYCLNG
jgi:hypothetical protein